MRNNGFTFKDLLVVSTVICLGVGGCLTANHRARETANRVKCQSNLSQIGKAILLYSNENKGAFPRTNAVAGAPITFTNEGWNNPKPFTTNQVNNIPAAMYLLVREEDVGTSAFMCPSVSTKADPVSNPKTQSNFKGDGNPGGSVLNHVTYSFINVYPSDQAVGLGYKTFVTAFSSDVAIAADRSPLSPSDPVWQTIKMGVPRATMVKGNSFNHAQDGQNILYADGHAEFQQTPLAGTHNDNVYTVNKLAGLSVLAPDGQSGTGMDPAHAADSVLLLHGK